MHQGLWSVVVSHPSLHTSLVHTSIYPPTIKSQLTSNNTALMSVSIETLLLTTCKETKLQLSFLIYKIKTMITLLPWPGHN